MSEVKIAKLCCHCYSYYSTCTTCQRCDQCCACILCITCGISNIGVSNICQLCQQCINCCRCALCRRCGAPHTVETMLCSSCGGGRSLTCRCCTNSSKLPKIKREVNLQRYAPSLSELVMNPSPRLISVELEVAGITCNYTTLQQTLKKWYCSIVADGSLPGSGCEINTHPAGGDRFMQQIQEICTAFTDSGTYITVACGGHIHVDARDFDYLAIARLTRLYACCEPIFYQMIPDIRRRSRYAVPWATNYLNRIMQVEKKMSREVNTRKRMLLYRQAILTELYGFTDKKNVADAHKSKSAHFSGGIRYRAFNLQSWMYRGTVEFRFPPGSVIAFNVQSWGMLLANMVDIAAHMTMDEIMALTKAAQDELYTKSETTEQLKLVKTLCPTTAIQDWITERMHWYKTVSHKLEAESPFHHGE